MAAITPGRTVFNTSTNSRASHPYTCNTCHVAFKGSDLQRGHMQSDWHRYNLKRRVASLPPLTSEIFAEKVLANQALAAATAAKVSFEKGCAACQRTYFSENAYENHLKSQKHKIRLSQLSNGHHEAETETETASMASSAFSLGDPIGLVKATQTNEEDPVAEEEFAKVIDRIKETNLDEDGDPIGRRPSRPYRPSDPTVQPAVSLSTSPSSSTPHPSSTPGLVASDPTLSCLFCNETTSDIGCNITHMKSTHGLFIPEQPYLMDLRGLLSYLHERVQILHECLYCGHTKHTATGIQTHMRDKGHCTIAFETEEEMIEVGQFYDFRSSYSDEELDDDDYDDGRNGDLDTPKIPGGVKLGATRAAIYTVVDEDGKDTEEDGWESDDNSEIGEDEDGVSTLRTAPRRTGSSNQAYQVDYELHLPSGRTAGHRSFARYYRQNLHSYPTPAARQQQQQLIDSGEREDDTERFQAGRRGRQLAVSRADGGLGMLSAPERAKKEAKAIEMKDRKRVERDQKRYQWGNEKRANMQKHFRDPLLQ